MHTFNPNVLLTVSPFYHYNTAHYIGGATDFWVITDANQKANYGGLQASVNATVWKNDIQAGVYGFGQHQSNFFNNQFTDYGSDPIELPALFGFHHGRAGRDIHQRQIQAHFCGLR